VKRVVRVRCKEIRALPLTGIDQCYSLKRSSARSTLALRVHDNGEVVVNAPLDLPLAHIERFLLAHADWLRARLLARQAETCAWCDGDRLPWLGASLCLKLHPPATGTTLWLQADTLHCPARPGDIAALVTRWYRQQAHPFLSLRLSGHAARAGLATPTLRISDARTRWGSLSAQGVVSLNWRLLKASLAEIDYVICHELAHHRLRNHSPAFWREVAALYPGWREARLALRNNARVYFRF